MSRPGTYITQPISRPTPLGDESSPWFWNPNLIGVQLAPEWFRKKLKEIDEDLEVTWNRDSERWQVWVRKRSLSTRLCQGWLYLFPVQTAAGEYVPLDERTFAKIYTVSARAWGGAKQYMDAVAREVERDKAAKEAAEADHTWYEAGQYYKHTKPWIGAGSRNDGNKMAGQ